jgi:hypothetical protein
MVDFPADIYTEPDLYGLRYDTHIVKPDAVETFHDQVGYWLWEPATGMVFYTLSIPRAQIAMAVGHAASGAKMFSLEGANRTAPGSLGIGSLRSTGPTGPRHDPAADALRAGAADDSRTT